MNYILHLNKTFEKFCEDEKLTPFHISLYYSLFQYWNMARFRNPISISRDELMRSSKIGSVNTYIRCIKELDKWQYIKYIPSYNPQKGSHVYLYSFNNSNDNSNNNGSDIPNNKGSNKTSGKASETQVIPYTNNSNIVNNINSVNGNEPTKKIIITKKIISDETTNSKKQGSKKENEISISSKKREESKQQKSSVKRENMPPTFKKRGGDNEVPTSEIITNYFFEKQWPILEGEKFFNYYESNGWLVGGKTPMHSWKACASNWMLNSEKFNNGKANQRNSVTSSGVEKRTRAGNLHSKTGKDYSEPL